MKKFNSERFIALINGLEEATDIYKRFRLSDTMYKINLANDDEIQIKYYPNNLAHILGVNVDYLRSAGFYDGSSYEVLEGIINNPNKLLNGIKNNYLSPNLVFSDYSEEKIKAFKRNTGIQFFDIDFIVEYKNERNYGAKNQLEDGYYFGYTDDSTLNIIGFVKSDMSNTYSPITNRTYERYSEDEANFLNVLFKNQIVTIPTYMKKNTLSEYGDFSSKPFYYQRQEKASKLKTIKRFTEAYGGSCDTIKDHIHHIDKVVNIQESAGNTEEILNYISKKINERKLIDMRSIESKFGPMASSFLNLIGAHNDSLVYTDKTNDENNYSYQSIIESLSDLKEEIKTKNYLISKLEEENETLSVENEVLKQENEKFIKNNEKIVRILTNK